VPAEPAAGRLSAKLTKPVAVMLLPELVPVPVVLVPVVSVPVVSVPLLLLVLPVLLVLPPPQADSAIDANKPTRAYLISSPSGVVPGHFPADLRSPGCRRALHHFSITNMSLDQTVLSQLVTLIVCGGASGARKASREKRYPRRNSPTGTAAASTPMAR